MMEGCGSVNCSGQCSECSQILAEQDYERLEAEWQEQYGEENE